MPLKRPLNPDAVKAADAKLAEKTGGRKLTMGPKDKALRAEWMEEYRKAAGEQETPDAPGQEVKGTTLPCGLTVYCFVGRYTYANRTGIAGAQYVLKDMGDKELARGTTDAEGRFKKEQILTPYAYFEVNKDPHPNEYFPQPPIPEVSKEEGQSAFESALEWLKGFLQGDFNENQSTSQILATAVVGMIPIVGQIMAGRDLLANLIKLIEFYDTKDQRDQTQIDKDDAEFFGLGKEFQLWLFIVLNAIQAFPTLGAAASGVIRLLFKELGAAAKVATPQKLKALFASFAEVLNKFGFHNAKKWLQEFKAEWPKIMQFAKTKIDDAINALEAGAAKLKGELAKLPEWVTGTKGAKQITEMFEKFKETLKKLRKGKDETLPKIEQNVSEKIDELSKAEGNLGKGGAADSTDQTLPQGAKDPPELKDTPPSHPTPTTGGPGEFADNAKLQDHFNRHGSDFGATSPAAYQQQAKEFLTGPAKPGTLEKVRPNGDVVRFDPATDKFGVIKADGTIKTLYKPDPAVHGHPTNLDYFNAQ